MAKWKNALLDLSLRNKLINYTERAGYRLEVPGPALGRFEDAVNDGARITLLASDAVKEIDVARGIRYGRDLPEQERELLLADKRSAYIDITAAPTRRKLRSPGLQSQDNRRGNRGQQPVSRVRDVELAIQRPRIAVAARPGTRYTISTTNRGDHYTLTLDEAGMSTPNYCLIEKLRVTFGLEIPGLTNPAQDASGIDLGATFDAVRRAIAQTGLHFRVEETVHLAILQFAKFPLWKDLDDSWKALSRQQLSDPPDQLA